MMVVDSFIFVAVEDSLTVLAYSSNEAGEYTNISSINCSECLTTAIQSKTTKKLGYYIIMSFIAQKMMLFASRDTTRSTLSP